MTSRDRASSLRQSVQSRRTDFTTESQRTPSTAARHEAVKCRIRKSGTQEKCRRSDRVLVPEFLSSCLPHSAFETNVTAGRCSVFSVTLWRKIPCLEPWRTSGMVVALSTRRSRVRLPPRVLGIGLVARLDEHLPSKQEDAGSSPAEALGAGVRSQRFVMNPWSVVDARRSSKAEDAGSTPAGDAVAEPKAAAGSGCEPEMCGFDSHRPPREQNSGIESGIRSPSNALPWPSGDGTSLTWRHSQVRVLPGVLSFAEWTGAVPARPHKPYDVGSNPTSATA